jgi:hypothetical protein
VSFIGVSDSLLVVVVVFARLFWCEFATVPSDASAPLDASQSEQPVLGL